MDSFFLRKWSKLVLSRSDGLESLALSPNTNHFGGGNFKITQLPKALPVTNNFCCNLIFINIYLLQLTFHVVWSGFKTSNRCKPLNLISLLGDTQENCRNCFRLTRWRWPVRSLWWCPYFFYYEWTVNY